MDKSTTHGQSCDGDVLWGVDPDVMLAQWDDSLVQTKDFKDFHPIAISGSPNLQPLGTPTMRWGVGKSRRGPGRPPGSADFDAKRWRFFPMWFVVSNSLGPIFWDSFLNNGSMASKWYLCQHVWNVGWLAAPQLRATSGAVLDWRNGLGDLGDLGGPSNLWIICGFPWPWGIPKMVGLKMENPIKNGWF